MGMVNDTGIWVKLEKAEVLQATIVAVERMMESIAKGLEHKPPMKQEDNALAYNIEGACGELAYAKARGIYYEPRVNTFKAPDFGSNVQIRTRSDHNYDLLIRDNDKPDHYYVLVTGTLPTYRIVGYILGADAMAQPAWRKNWGGRGEAWFVPQKALTPFPSKEKAA